MWRLTTISAVLGAALVLASCGTGAGSPGGPSGDDGASHRARRALIDLIDDTVREVGAGLTFQVDDDAARPAGCDPDDAHSWTYSKSTRATGARADKLVRDVETYWRGLGHEVKPAGKNELFLSFDDLRLTVHGVGTNGADGIFIGGSTQCFPGEGSQP